MYMLEGEGPKGASGAWCLIHVCQCKEDDFNVDHYCCNPWSALASRYGDVIHRRRLVASVAADRCSPVHRSSGVRQADRLMSGVETIVAPSAASGRRWSAMLMMATLLVAGTLTSTAVAQETTQPVDPVGTERGMVRFVNLSPNASPATLSLSDDDGAVVAPTEFEGLSFGAETDYLPVPVGGY